MTETEILQPVRRSVGVDCPLEEAFRVFTREIASWWPVESHSVHGREVAEVVFEERPGGELYELASGGERHVWATVTAWEPPRRLVLEWVVNPERPATEVEVTFTAYDDGHGTRVELEHRGWGADDARRNGYESGWELVLGRFAARAGTR